MGTQSGRALRQGWAALALGGRRFSVGYILVFIFVVCGLTETHTFLSGVTMRVVLGQQAVIAVLALAVLVPLTTSTFDLSVGANLGLSLVIVCWLSEKNVMPVGLACLVAVLCSAGVGLINGIAVVRFHIGSFIATLGTSEILVAAALILSQNQQIIGTFSVSFRSWGNRNVLGLPVVFYYLILLGLILWFVLEHTPLGRRMYAVGGNMEAARLAGVPASRLILGSLVCSGLISGIAGVIFAAQNGVFDNSYGEPQLFPAFAAVFLGATQIKNRPNVWGTILAVYTLEFGVQGLEIEFPSSAFWVTPLFNGIALVIAVGLASRPRRVRLAS